MKDGLYQVRWRNVCAGFIIEKGRVTVCAPILRRRVEFFKPSQFDFHERFANTGGNPRRRKVRQHSTTRSTPTSSCPVKYLAGCNYLAGDFITPAQPCRQTHQVRRQSQSSTTGYKYFCEFARRLYSAAGR
jgi:hypothetical protein